MKSRFVALWALSFACASGQVFLAGETTNASQPGALDMRVLDRNPILRAADLGGDGKGGLVGPSVIRVPDWATNRLGRYYMYVAQREDRRIRLVYADAVEGPWRIHEPGVLTLNQLGSTGSNAHLSFPEVVVDNELERMRLYFTYRSTGDVAATSVALSSDGLQFEPQPLQVEASGLRAFRWGPYTLFLDEDGGLWRSADGLKEFEKGGVRFGEALKDDAAGVTFRRGCFVVRGWTGRLFFSREGDQPESLLFSSVRLFGEAKDWAPAAPVVALAGEGENLSDPSYLEDGNRQWLFYATSAGAGIAVAELKEP